MCVWGTSVILPETSETNILLQNNSLFLNLSLSLSLSPQLSSCVPSNTTSNLLHSIIPPPPSTHTHRHFCHRKFLPLPHLTQKCQRIYRIQLGKIVVQEFHTFPFLNLNSHLLLLVCVRVSVCACALLCYSHLSSSIFPVCNNNNKKKVPQRETFHPHPDSSRPIQSNQAWPMGLLQATMIFLLENIFITSTSSLLLCNLYIFTYIVE